MVCGGEVLAMSGLYLSHKDIERLSQKVISEYMRLPKVRIQSEVKKIDPFILAENYVGLRVDFRHLSKERQIFGLTSYMPTYTEIINDSGIEELFALDGRTILIEEDLASDPMPGKYNFTIVHETSHHILRKLFPNEYGPQNINYSMVHYYRSDVKKDITDWEEWQANTLTAALLMPESLLRTNMNFVGLGEKLCVFNRKYKRDEYDKFNQLACIMGVSLTALRIRMKQLGLIGKDHYGCPERIFEIDYD